MKKKTDDERRQLVKVIGPDVIRWISDCCELGSRFMAPTCDLYDSFCEWCDDQQIPRWTIVAFGTELTRQSFLKRSGRDYPRVGLRLKAGVGGDGPIDVIRKGLA